MAGPYPFVDINFHSSDSHYAFTSPSNPTAPTLVVDRPSGDLRLTDGKVSGAKRVSSIAGILGMIRMRLDKYIIIITKSQSVGKIRGSTIYQVVATELLPIRDRPLHDADEDAYLNLVRSVLSNQPMYFSYNLDITNSFQRQAQSSTDTPFWQQADDRFFWNKFISRDLIDFRSGNANSSGLRLSVGTQTAVDPFILPVISGTFSLKRTSIKGNPLTFLLITRKSRHRIGTRYFSRGIDEEGHVSNFNETEQAVVLNDSDSALPGGYGSPNGNVRGNSGRDVQIMSYVQTRGSVPVYWAEVNKLKYTPDLQIRGVDSALDAAKAHFAEQIGLYGDNYLINLVNQKGREKRVKDAYEQLVRALQSAPADARDDSSRSSESVRIIESRAVQQQFDRLHYVYFDFHNETKGLKWHRAQLLLDELHEPLIKQAYFHGAYDRSGRADVRQTQRSVARTNCMDCLDRTNVIQSMLGRAALDRMLGDAGILSARGGGGGGGGESAGQDAAFEHVFRNVWADNADTVSRSYSGTGALKTDFTRTGRRTRQGALQDLASSVTRYARNNFLDGPRQDAFDLFAGAFLPEVGPKAVFADARPLAVQAAPYAALAGAFFVLVALAGGAAPGAAVLPLRLLTLLAALVAAYAAAFVLRHGTLYVNWPKLNTPPWAVDAYGDGLAKAAQDPLLGSFVAMDGRHERGRSEGGLKMSYMEEGKKRIE